MSPERQPLQPPERRRPVFRDLRSAESGRARPVSAPAPATAPLPRPPASAGAPKKSRRLWWLAAVAALVLLALPAWYVMHSRGGSSDDNRAKPAAGTASPDTIRMFATGDFIAHDSVNAAAKRGDSYNYLPLMDDFVPLFKKADIRFCNDPILNGGNALGIAGYPYFNSPTEFVTDMGRLGCNLVNTASNHSFDFTQAHINASVDAWENVPNMLAVAGQNRSPAERDAVHYFTIKGVKFAFLAYTTYLNNTSAGTNDYGVNRFSHELAGRQIAEAKQNGAQFIMVSMRWGTEYSGTVDARQTAEAQWLADQGVQLVLGHGPHVLQPARQLTGAGGTKTLVWYSLGNFLNSQIPPETLFNGIAVMDISVKTRQITAIRYLPVYMHYEWTAKQAAAEDTGARHNLHLYLLEDATQQMLDAQQLDTTIAAQKQRISSTLDAGGLTIPLITSGDL